MRVLLVALAVALLLPGCVQQGPAAAVTPAAATNASDHELNLVPLEAGTRDAVDAPPGLDAPPVWRQGEWWTVRVKDGFDGAVYEGTRVVAGREGASYLVGMPKDKWSNELMVLHVPGFGQVNQSDLSFDIHNARFEPLKFPLTEGREWDTKFEGRPLHATVHVENPTTAIVSLQGKNDHMNVTYDATLGEASKMVIDNYATLEVTGHGFDYTGVVTVPHMFELVFQNARIAGALDISQKPAPPSETVKVDSTYDRVSFVLIVGTILPAPAASGYYKETATGPDGKTFTLEMLPSEPGPLKLAFFQADKPGGEWRFDHVAAGPGLTLAEGIAYHVYNVDMPTGHILASTGEHKHGG